MSGRADCRAVLAHYRERHLVIQQSVTLSLDTQHLSSNWDIFRDGRAVIITGPRHEPGMSGKIQDQVTRRAHPGPGVQGDTVTVGSGPKRIKFVVIPSDQVCCDSGFSEKPIQTQAPSDPTAAGLSAALQGDHTGQGLSQIAPQEVSSHKGSHKKCLSGTLNGSVLGRASRPLCGCWFGMLPCVLWDPVPPTLPARRRWMCNLGWMGFGLNLARG